MTYPPSGSEFPDAQPWPGDQPAFGPGYPAGPSYPALGAYPQQPVAPAYGPPNVPGAPGYPTMPGYPQAPGYTQGPGYPQTPGYPAAPGYPQAFPQGPGYPPGFPGPGFPGGPPPSSNNAKWWLIGGLSVLVIVGVVAILGLSGVFNMHQSSGGTSASGDSSFGSGSDDKAQIRSLLTNMNSDGGDFMQTMRQHSCAKDQQLYDKIGAIGPIKVPTDSSGAGGGTATISDIEVDGSKATAQITAGGAARLPLTLYFRKESGDWKICMSDSPMFGKVFGGN